MFISYRRRALDPAARRAVRGVQLTPGSIEGCCTSYRCGALERYLHTRHVGHKLFSRSRREPDPSIAADPSAERSRQEIITDGASRPAQRARHVPADAKDLFQEFDASCALVLRSTSVSNGFSGYLTRSARCTLCSRSSLALEIVNPVGGPLRAGSAACARRGRPGAPISSTATRSRSARVMETSLVVKARLRHRGTCT